MRLLIEQLTDCSTADFFDVLRIHGLQVRELPQQIHGLVPTVELARLVFTITNPPDHTISADESLALFIRNRYLSGDVQHNDCILREDEHQDFITPCVSRAAALV